MKEILLFWALKNNQIVHISEVLNGLKYECVCPVCNGKLEAHKGQKKVDYFKHIESTNCQGSLETSIYLASKRLYLARKEVLLPDLFADVPEFGYQKIQSKKLYKSKTVVEGQKKEDLQNDLLMEIEIKKKEKKYLIPLIVEISTTHIVDAEKLSKIKNNGVSAVEVCLKQINRIKNDDELWSELTNPVNIRWLFNSKLSTLIEKKRLNQIEHQKNIEKKIERTQEAKEKESREFKRQNFSLFKIYNFRKDYGRKDMMTGYIPFEGIVYCPKDKINNENKKIALEECENCVYHFDKHFATTHIDSDVFVVCGLKAKKLREFL